MTAPRINYLAPRVQIDVADASVAQVVSLEVRSTRVSAGDACRIVLADGFADSLPPIAKGDALAVSWGYAGFDLEKIFSGTVDDAARKERQFVVDGIDRGAALLRTRVTKTYAQMPAGAIIQDLAGAAGLDTSKIAADGPNLDRLPLDDRTVAEALRIINRRLDLAHDFWVDLDGACRWEPRDYGQQPTAVFTHGVDILEFEERDGRARLVTLGCALSHSVVVTVVKGGGGPAAWFVEAVRHSLRPGKGSRTELHLEACP